jgi:outer membrane receptor for ferrienterochelin and colicins
VVRECRALTTRIRFYLIRTLITGAALYGRVGVATAQIPVQRATSPDTLAIARISVRHDSTPIRDAVVRSGALTTRTDSTGTSILRLAAGPHTVTVSRIGFRPDTARLTLRASQDTTIAVALIGQPASLEGVVVSSTRGVTRVEDTPLRVEIIDDEEVAEKVAMTPGDIVMMLNETSGLRIQSTNPSLGGANVRIQGLRGRYSLILADGLPLYGGQAGGIGLLQIPPLDLQRVEIIKGSASALYGSSALGGVINLVSRRPGKARDATALVNQTTRGGTDAVAFITAPLTRQWGYTLLTGAHHQRQNDLDVDGWTDMPGYERVVVRPRFFFDDGRGHTAFATGGFTAEDRVGGTLESRALPGGGAFVQSLRTRRADVAGLVRWSIADTSASGVSRALHGAIVTLRGSAVESRLGHLSGDVREHDAHRTWFSEVSLALPRGRVTYITGAALQHDAYQNADVAGFDYAWSVPALFAQADVDVSSWLSLSSSARADVHSEYGTLVNPRVSLLLRKPGEGAFAEWTSRLSAGTGAFTPTPFTEETETTGLTPLLRLTGLHAERARSVSADVGGPLATAIGRLEMNATAFASRISSPIAVYDADGTTVGGATRIALANAPAATQTWGGEFLARQIHPFGDDHEPQTALRVTATYAYLRSTECAPTTIDALCARREVPLTPRHTAGVVATIETEATRRLGFEFFYTGRQSLDQNPFRRQSRAYAVIGLLGEQTFKTVAGRMRVFLNLENLTDVRQTRYDPLLLRSRGQGGRWATDAWTELAGFTANGGVRLSF